MKNPKELIPAAALILLAGCASVEPPVEQIAHSQTAVQQAHDVGAREYAPLELRQATQKLEQAQAAMAEEEYLEARRLAEQAQVDAELAQTMALSEEAEAAAHELRESIRILREEIARPRG